MEKGLETHVSRITIEIVYLQLVKSCRAAGKPIPFQCTPYDRPSRESLCARSGLISLNNNMTTTSSAICQTAANKAQATRCLYV